MQKQEWQKCKDTTALFELFQFGARTQADNKRLNTV
jgi:hypothetical protein